MTAINSIIDEFDLFGILPHSLPNAIGMWPNEQECLVWCALQANPFYNWMEIGSFCGGSAVLLALVRKVRGIGKYKVLSIDNNFNPLFDHNVYNRGKFHNIVEKIQCNSIEILKHYNQPLSFIFLDGWHSFASVVKEFELLQPLMSDDCIIAFHDISPDMYDNNCIQGHYEFAVNNWESLINSTQQDFRLDEAVAYICMTHNYKILDIPVRKNETHFTETKLDRWVRGTTSPFNSFTAISRK